ncbi:MAG: hypothetical protein PHC69_03725 [Ruminiclostridium sp.]|nr:hypothetical protein [Ruminiclostridium sp.]
MFNDYGDLGGFGALAIFGVIFGFIFILIAIAFYIFFSLALFKLAQRRGIEMAWLAWIPIAQMYIVGLMVKKVNISSFEIPKLEIVLPAAMLGAWILGMIPFIGIIFTLAFYALILIVLYNLYNQYVPEKAMTYTLLSILVVTIPFLLYGFRDKDPINVPQ